MFHAQTEDHLLTAFKREIIDTLTGERVTSLHPDGEKFHPFWWSGGNGSCDCNRFANFMRAKCPDMTDVENDDLEYPCDHGDPRFRVKMFGPNDVLLYDDSGDFAKPFVIPH
ncbi:hypothetical protein ACOI1H_19175 [Loktanella sp. DJP18]|uniref:hypothetical protein n=1 Tax=Loktanella sp. DJP18 TaxID=3409788 RepID=UPI003BB5809A